MIDLEAIKAKWLNICGACDAGIGECNHPSDDYRPVMLELVQLLEHFRDNALVMLDGKGGWYGVPSGGNEVAAIKFAMPPDYAPLRSGPSCDAPHPMTDYVCSRRSNHSDPWHVASNGKILLARWAQ